MTLDAFVEAAVVEVVLASALTGSVKAKHQRIVDGVSELALSRAANALSAVESWSTALAAPLAEEMKRALQDILVSAPAGVTTGHVSPDGLHFRLSGPSWSPALSSFGAGVTLELQRRLAPSCRPYLQGGFESPLRAPTDWSEIGREDTRTARS